MESCEIYILKVAERVADSSYFMYLTDPGKEKKIYYYFWCLVASGKAILVDTGFPPKVGQNRGATNCVSPEELLKMIKIEPVQVEKVILTHLHWDHSSSLKLFPSSSIYVQKSELDYIKSHLFSYPSANRFYPEREYLHHLQSLPGIKVIDGDMEISPGVWAIKMGGHTPGSQIVAIETNKVIIAGDVCPMYRNLEEDLPGGIFYSLTESLTALQKLKAMVGMIVPGHDPLVFKKALKLNENIGIIKGWKT
ncbi:N-acyl homoserine lactonase family protein [Neomoorella mulderi]|uniref:N-acyl homoserine lactonase n=1 Tax=Moorella mulderi DSM 14980 TaxID=1122241 RepID=A0A151AW55_9FIRM|nr:N-acyl homoserine lactonase family protein [Moorella mulderi]KYH31792.1 N-acyl homoserine lactonase [Moorella mulderi DSM 14980]